MIVYFADRQLNILGQASTGLPAGLTLSKDRKGEDVETGVAVFECYVRFSHNTRRKVEAFAEVGNFILRKNGDECELYTIIDSETDTKKQTVYVYAEDAGLDLLNEVVGEYEADKAYPIAHYIEKFAYDSGFRIGTNEAASLSRKLVWDDEQTVTARLASVATQFDGCEISYSFKIKGLRITNKLINIYKQRGKDVGATLWLNQDIDNIIIKKSIANLATALRAKGGTPDDKDDPITLRGYEYDDGDFYIDGDCLKSRTALAKWSRYLNPNEPNQKDGHEGHLVQPFSYDTTDQATLCQKTIAELKKLREIEVNYDAEIKRLPDNVKIGDRVNIVDEVGELFLSTRILQLEVSVCEQEIKAVLGEHLIKESGISAKVEAQAAEFALQAQATKQALAAAKAAAAAAETAQETANNAQSAVDNVEIGGANLLLNSKTIDGDNIATAMEGGISGTYKELNVYSYDYSAATEGARDIVLFKQIFPEKLGAVYTLSFYAKGSGTLRTYFYGETGYLQCAKTEQSTGHTSTPGDGSSAWELTDTWTRYWVTWTLKTEGDITLAKYVLFRLYYGGTVDLCGFKLEKGNKATDWTPAPEDVDNSINASTESLNNTISEQRTSVMAYSKSLAQSTLETCVEKAEYEENKEAVKAQMEEQAAQTETKLNAATEQISTVDGELQDFKNQYGRHFEFSDETAVTISTGDKKAQIAIDPVTGIAYKTNGETKSYWNDDDFYVGNMVVDVTKRARFGPIAFVPRSDGSLSILKVK